jgi:hypothetical protein
MKKNIYFLLLIIILICCSCRQGKEKNNESMDSVKTDSIHKCDSVMKADSLKNDTTSPANKKDSNINSNVQNNVKPVTEYVRDFVKEGYVKATVKNYSGLDGCGFLLVLESGKKLEPSSLDKKFRIDNSKVWIKYTPANYISICMTGETVTITAIETRDEK